MIEQQQKLILSPYIDIYDLIIPQDNLLRKIKELARDSVISISKYDAHSYLIPNIVYVPSSFVLAFCKSLSSDSIFITYPSKSLISLNHCLFSSSAYIGQIFNIPIEKYFNTIIC